MCMFCVARASGAPPVKFYLFAGSGKAWIHVHVFGFRALSCRTASDSELASRDYMVRMSTADIFVSGVPACFRHPDHVYRVAEEALSMSGFGSFIVVDRTLSAWRPWPGTNTYHIIIPIIQSQWRS